MLTFLHPITDFTGHGAGRRFGDLPETCPLCHHHVDPRRLTAHATNRDNTAVDFTFQCPRPECRRVFIGRYRLGPDGEYDLASVEPHGVRRETVPYEVEAFSPAFVEVYGQAQEAEARGHRELAAIGLRRALELLVKDFAAAQDPDHEDEIRRSTLAACTARFVDDPHLKACASRAFLAAGDADGAGLGDLKVLVRLTVNWIGSVLLERDYLAAVPA
ncbi:MAG TPA: hypothetical protein VF771_08105 [Longimicrobiaceae bacterium]